MCFSVTVLWQNLSIHISLTESICIQFIQVREFPHTPNCCAWAKQDLVHITPTNSSYFTNSFTCFSITFEWTQFCLECIHPSWCRSSLAVLVWIDWPVDVVAVIFPEVWLVLLSDSNFWHRLIECIDLCIMPDEWELNYDLL